MDRSRLNESVEACLSLGEGRLVIASASEEDTIVSENLSCAKCDISIEELEPRNFSFNTPYGACKSCSGLGYKLQIEPELIIPDPNKKLIDGAIVPWTLKNGALAWEYNFIRTLSEVHEFSVEDKVKNLDPDTLKLILYGSKNDVYPVRYSSKRGRERIWRDRKSVV